ncbi:MAG: lipoyl(octanoyl) transferase LipB, partial [Myxococcota bacterium]
HMRRAVEQIRQALREGRAPHSQLLLLEHRPVVTVTRGGEGRHVRLDTRALERLGVELVQTDRGGDVTYHGPGQLVGYPIVPLPRGANFIGVGRYLRRLERALLDACGELGVSRCMLLPGKTGVWLGKSKLVAIGIGVSKDGITRHGFAVNVCADLALMQRCIVPCGLTGMGVANLDDVLWRQGVAVPSVPRLCRVIATHVAAGLGMRARIEQPFCPRLSPRSS